MPIARLAAEAAEGITARIEDAQGALGDLWEPRLRLGVTGLARAGKTVFIASLVANLLDRGRMRLLDAEAEGRILAAGLAPFPDRRIPRFAQEAHMADLLGEPPRWPESTRALSTLRLSFRLAAPRGLAGLASGLTAGLTGPRRLHLDVTDYPGEWLADLALLSLDYAAWSAEAIAVARTPARAPHAGAFLAAVEGAAQGEVEAEAARLAALFTDYLRAGAAAGLSGLAPGRFLAPGELEGSPALAFAPLPPGTRSALRTEMARRYETYRREVARPFFREHFARLDRQVVLVDLLAALSGGPRAVEDLRRTLGGVLAAFRPGGPSWLAPFLGRRTDRILFAVTKADHVHHVQHPALAGLLRAVVREAADRAELRGVQTRVMALAALRATTEQMVSRDGRELACVRGVLAETGRPAVLHPGALPDDPAGLLAEARAGAEAWRGPGFAAHRFAAPRLRLGPGEGPPHIRLDRAAQFLIGDRLR